MAVEGEGVHRLSLSANVDHPSRMHATLVEVVHGDSAIPRGSSEDQRSERGELHTVEVYRTRFQQD
eukprot:2096660-Pyramimonas_sp.AAC.1